MAHRKHCNSCSKDTIHNERGKKDEPARCTYCGSPVTTNPAKREYWELIRKQQVAKAGRLA